MVSAEASRTMAMILACLALLLGTVAASPSGIVFDTPVIIGQAKNGAWRDTAGFQSLDDKGKAAGAT